MGMLRVLLAVCVVLAHVGSFWGVRLINGMMPVQIFFIISGFYMSLILETKYTGDNSYKVFITNRFLRIFPAYLVLLFAFLLISLTSGLLTGQWMSLSSYLQWHHEMGIGPFLFLIASNLIIFGQDVVMFLGLNVSNGALFFTENFRDTSPQLYNFLVIPPAWSLGVELVFYLIAPLILRKNIYLILGLISASLLMRLYMFFGWGLTNDPWPYRFFPTEMLFFLLGNISYRIFRRIKDGPVYKKPSLCVTAIYFATFIFYMFIPGGEEFKKWSFYLFTAFCLPFIFNFTRFSYADRRIGELSYLIYLVHWFIMSNLTFDSQSFVQASLKTSLVLFLSVLSSIVLLKFVVDPIDRYRQARVISFRRT